MYIEIKNVSKSYVQKGVRLQVLDDISLEIEQGEFICLLGPSGCGKSTLLSTIAGFEKPDMGVIRINGTEVKNPSPKYVTIFQNYGLLPWRSVLKNVELGLENKKISKQERHETAREFLELVGLKEFDKSYPHQLSGGMQQRVSIARALAVNPDILFMDEPFGALDAITRIKMQNDILEIAKKAKKTIVFVTHDIEEAAFLADRIVVMTPNPGKIKSIVNVRRSSLRDRTSPDFLLVRDKVFDIFNMKPEVKNDYVI